MTAEAVTPSATAKKTSRAVAMMALQSVVVRVVLFGSNWVLGGILTHEAFGVSGLTFVVSAFAWTLVGFGLDDVLIQRGRGLRFWEGTSFWVIMSIGVAGGIATAALAPAIAHIFREPKIIGPVLVCAATLPIAALSVVASAKLNARLDFNFIIRWGIVELFLTQGLSIAFALAGFEEYSFVLPLPIVFACRAVAYNWRAPPRLRAPQRNGRTASLLNKGSVVTGSKLINNIIGQGDYLILGLLSSATSVGYYFFAFRLAAAPVKAIALSLNSVLFPAMSAQKAGETQLAMMAVRAARLLSWIVSPLCYFQIVIAAPILHLAFGDKWDASIPIIQVLSVGLALEGLMAVTRAYLSAAGKFRIALIYSTANGIGFLIACAIGTFSGGAVGLALGVSIYYVVSQPLLFSILVDRSDSRIRNLWEIFGAPTLVSILAFGGSWLVADVLKLFSEPLLSIACSTAVGWVAFLGLFALAAPNELKRLLDLARSIAGSRMGRKSEA